MNVFANPLFSSQYLHFLEDHCLPTSLLATWIRHSPCLLWAHSNNECLLCTRYSVTFALKCYLYSSQKRQFCHYLQWKTLRLKLSNVAKVTHHKGNGWQSRDWTNGWQPWVALERQEGTGQKSTKALGQRTSALSTLRYEEMWDSFFLVASLFRC
jgi:hypothetical protein